MARSLEEIFKDLRERVDELRAKSKDRIHPDDTREGVRNKLPFRLFAFAHTSAHRVIDLTESSLLLHHERRPVPCLILVRSLFETVALMHVVAKNASKALADKCIDSIDNLSERALVGRSNTAIGPTPLKLGRIIAQLATLVPTIKSDYDLLSEYSHPSAPGMLHAYSCPEDNTRDVDEKIWHRLGRDAGILPDARYFATVTLYLLLLANMTFDSIVNDVPPIAELAEICNHP